MSIFSISAELHQIEKMVKEELFKASMNLQGEFQQQLNMERQDRQVMLANIWHEIEQQGSAISTVTEKLVAFCPSDQISEQQEAIRKLESQQHAMENIIQDNELFALKMSEAEKTIAELKRAVAGYASIHEHLMREAARQSAVHADIMHYIEAAIQNDQVQELRRECNSQRLQLDDQSAKFTAIAAENDTLRLQLSAVESSFEDVHRASAARSPLDLSMQSELHSQVLALKETVAQLCIDVAVQSSMKADYLLQQEALERLHKEVSKLRLYTTPAPATVNVNLEQSIQKLRADMEKKFTYFEQQTPTGIASTIADALFQRFADNMHKAERTDKLVEGVQATNLAGADRNQDMQESKEGDLSFNKFVAAGEWSAAKGAPLEGLSKHSSDASSSIHPLPAPEGISTDPETVWIPAYLKKSLATFAESIQSNLKMQATTPASVQSQRAEGGGSLDTQSRRVSPHFPRRRAESPRFLNQLLMQNSFNSQSMSRSRAYGFGGQHIFNSESGGLFEQSEDAESHL